MTQTPLISVVVPTFRRPGYLERALGSVLTQTHRELEVIVADDGGDDETAAVVRDAGDQRIRHLARAERLGIFANNLDALRSTTGAYLIKLDDDDFWDERLCATLLEPLVADQTLACAFSDHWLVDEDGTVDPAATDTNSARWGRATLAPGKHQPFYDLAVEGTLPAQFTTLFRRDRLDLDSFPPELGGVYDRWLAVAASRGGGGAYYVDERLGYYCIHDSSYTATRRPQMAREITNAYELALADPALAPVRPRVKQLLAGYAADLALALLREPRPGGRAEARRAALRSLRLNPRPRAAAAFTMSLLPSKLAAHLEHTPW